MAILHCSSLLIIRNQVEPEPTTLDKILAFFYKPWLTRFIFLFSFIWQVINLLIVEFVYSKTRQDVKIVILIMAIFQVLRVITLNLRLRFRTLEILEDTYSRLPFSCFIIIFEEAMRVKVDRGQLRVGLRLTLFP